MFLGTASWQLKWAAAASLAFSSAVLFSSVVSSPLAAAARGMLISFLLPAAIPAPLGMAHDRLLGWPIAGRATLAAAAACRALAAQICPDLPPGGHRALPGSPVENLRQVFFRSPYRPAGLGTGPRMLVQTVQQILLDSVPDHRPLRRTCDGAPAAALLAAASALLSDSARLLSGQRAGPGSLGDAIERVRLAGDALTADATRCLTTGTPPPVPTVVLSAGATLEAALHAKEAADVAVEVPTYVQFAAAARSRP